MTVLDVTQDLDALTVTLTAQFPAPVEHVWRLWADPRLLERWWGPPTYPATFVEHDLSPGGRVTYYMTGPEGDRHGGWWRVISVEPPQRLEFEDGFADADGNPDASMPTTTAVVTIEPAPDGATRMTLRSRFPSVDVFEQMAAMGMVEGITAAVGQMDALLSEEAVQH
jgi:uncharacterized protein YndB with AHSA1/START domain